MLKKEMEEEGQKDEQAEMRRREIRERGRETDY